MKYYLYLLIILPFVVLPLFFAWAQTCQSETGGYCADLAALPYAQISGLEFLGDVNGIGDLISKLYVFGVGLAALAAFIMFTVGGVAYLTAGDNESQVTKAKSFMKNAVFGLTLGLLSWLILFTINPDLVKTLDLKLTPIGGGGGTMHTRESCISENLIWCSALNKCVTELEECVGGGASEYRWIQLGLNESCSRILGRGWQGVNPNWCGETPPPGNTCCGKF